MEGGQALAHLVGLFVRRLANEESIGVAPRRVPHLAIGDAGATCGQLGVALLALVQAACASLGALALRGLRPRA